jgi:mannitol-1-phosphate 5-dehydrogenase
MHEVVIIGAGKIGRGYMAQIFFENGYRVIFVDILPDLIEALNRTGTYEIHEVDTGIHDVFPISGVRVLHASDVELVCEALSHVSLAVTSVGAGNLPDVAENIAVAIRYRKQHQINAILNILVAENLMNGAQKFKVMIQEHLNAEEVAFMQEKVGIVGTVIGRIVPPPPPTYAQQSLVDVIVEPHREFYINRDEYLGEIPDLSGIHVTNRYSAIVARKLYVHNSTHAVMGYLGHQFRHHYSHDAMSDERVSPVVWQAMEETAAAVEREFGFSHADMQGYIRDLFHRYQNAALWDTLDRIGKDPIRKLQPDDRLVGAARLIEKNGSTPKALATGIAAAFCFNVADDLTSQHLQQQITRLGIGPTMERITGISSEDCLGIAVLKEYHRLRQC